MPDKSQQFKNEMHLHGQLARDPETRYTTGGKVLTHLNVLTRYDKYSEFHRVALWEQLAEKAATLTKGQVVQIVGRLQTRSWEDPTTKVKRYTTEIVAFQLVVPGKDSVTTSTSEDASPVSGGKAIAQAILAPEEDF